MMVFRPADMGICTLSDKPVLSSKNSFQQIEVTVLHSSEFQGVDYFSPDLEYSDHNPVVMRMRL